MKKPFRFLHEKSVISFFIWTLTTLFALLFLPNLTHLVETQAIPFNLPTKQVKVNWGNHLDHASQLTVVYSNHNHRLSQHNNKQIDSIERKIQEHKPELGILKLVSTKTSPYSNHAFYSLDKKAILLELWVPKNQLQHPDFINKLQHQCSINGLETHITSPELINHSIAENTIQKSKVAVLTAFCFALIFFLIVFKSILLPILSMIPLVISYIVSLSIIANLSQQQILPFSTEMPLLVALIVLLLGTVTTFLIYHRLTISLTSTLGRKTRRKYALAALVIPLILIVSVISLAFLSFHWFDFLTLKALSNLIIPILITTIATINLNSIFIKIFQTKLFWPGKPQNKILTSHIWQRLVKFSLWQPLAGIILLSLISFPLITSSHLKFNFSNYQMAEKKLLQGQRIMQSHFNFGKPTPVTIYLKNNHKLTNEHDLAVIDHLTTKLQAMKNVASVQSVTQPGGTKVKKYYLQPQLAKLSQSLHRSNQELKLMRQTLHKINQTELNKNTIDSQQNELTQLSQSINATLQLSQQESLTTDDANQINFLLFNLERLNQNGAIVSGHFTQYTKTLKSLNDSLQIISEKLRLERHQNKKDLTDLNQLSHAQSIQNLIFITHDNLEDTDFVQNCYNFNSQNQKTTKLIVNFDNLYESKLSPNEIKKLQQLVSSELQGTSLKHTVVTYAGMPVQSSRLQLHFKSILPAVSLFLLVLLIGIILISQSILQPVYWISCLLLSIFIGTNFTTLITKQSFSWNSILILITIIGLYGGIELLLLAFSFRSWNNDSLTWLKTSLQSFSKLNTPILLAFILIISSCSLWALPSLPLVAVTAVVTLLFFNFLLPIVLATTIKLTKMIKQQQRLTDKNELI